MLYCKKCKLITENNDRCNVCGTKKLSLPQENDVVYLATRNEVYSGMIEGMLKENKIPCLKIGDMVRDRIGFQTYKIFVPFGAYKKAKELLDNFFAESKL